MVKLFCVTNTKSCGYAGQIEYYVLAESQQEALDIVKDEEIREIHLYIECDYRPLSEHDRTRLEEDLSKYERNYNVNHYVIKEVTQDFTSKRVLFCNG